MEVVYVMPWPFMAPDLFITLTIVGCILLVVVTAICIIAHRIKYGNWSGYVGPGNK